MTNGNYYFAIFRVNNKRFYIIVNYYRNFAESFSLSIVCHDHTRCDTGRVEKIRRPRSQCRFGDCFTITPYTVSDFAVKCKITIRTENTNIIEHNILLLFTLCTRTETQRIFSETSFDVRVFVQITVTYSNLHFCAYI